MAPKFAYNADAKGFPVSLIAKFPSHRPEVLETVRAGGVYQREVAAYRFLGSDTRFRIPRCYFAASGPDVDFNLILEDLTDVGVPGDQIAGCDIAQAEAAVRELAALHTAYWDKDEIKTLDWLFDLASRAPLFSSGYARGAPLFRARYAALLGAEALDIIETLVPLIEPWCSVRPSKATLIHGEPRLDNMIFENTLEGLRACLIDLQFVASGDPIFDLAYFLTGSLSPENRRACEERLVREHAQTIQAIDPTYDFDLAWTSYRAHAIAGLMITVFAAAAIEPTPHNHELLTVLARRNCAAIADLDGIAQAEAMIAAHRQKQIP